MAPFRESTSLIHCQSKSNYFLMLNRKGVTANRG